MPNKHSWESTGENSLQQAGDLSPMQFGFRKARSTIDAIKQVTDLAGRAIEGSRWRGRTKEYCIVMTLAELLCSASAAAIKDWLVSVGLQLADQKTEAVLINSRKIVEVARIRMDGMTITSSRVIRYLGVWIDTRLSYREHLKQVGKKAAVIGQALNRIMLNTRGPKQSRRLLLQNVVKATMLYCAPVFL